MKKIIIPLILLLFLFCCSQKEELVVKLHIEGKEYDQLFMSCWIVDEPERTIIEGIKEGDNTWIFPINDSIFENTSLYSFSYALRDTADGKSIWGTSYSLSFVALNESDSLKQSQLIMDKNQMEYHAKYLTHSTFEREYDGKILQILENDSYIIPYEESTEYAVASKYVGFACFYDYKNNQPISYADGLDLYRKITEEHPDSRYLISWLHSFKSNFQTKEDLLSIYNLFSEDKRNSVFGRKILEHANTYLSLVDFENTVLPQWETNEPEDIIQDLSKNTLIIFSASWCGPCRAQIPLLKEIHKDLSEKLNIVYVSMDDSSTVDDWRKEMEKEEIPWRSVLATNNLDEINKKYYLNAGIPHTLLFRAEDGKVEVVDVRDEKDKQMVYDLSK